MRLRARSDERKREERTSACEEVLAIARICKTEGLSSRCLGELSDVRRSRMLADMVGVLNRARDGGRVVGHFLEASGG